MKKQQYEAVFAWFGARPRAKAALHAAAAVAVAGVYALYIGLLLWLAVARQPLFWAEAGVPAAVFLLGTALRRCIDRPRPYEALGFAPLFPKQTRGEAIYYVKANGTKFLDRFRLRTPTTSNIPPMLELMKGCQLADVPLLILTIDPCISCTER